MVTASLSGARLRSALSLFSDEDQSGRAVFHTHFESVTHELGRLLSIDPFPLSTLPAMRARRLVSAGVHASVRLVDLLLRQSYLRWLREHFAAADAEGRWRAYGSLAIKDFHADTVSLIDSVAPFLLLLERDLTSKEQERPPGFAQLMDTSWRARSSLGPRVLASVNATSSWWPALNTLRNTLIHRDHSRITFGSAHDGFWFQVLDRDGVPFITHPALLAQGPTQVVDFLVYSTWLVTETLLFLKEVGTLATSHLGFSADPPSTRSGEFGQYLATLRLLIERTS